MVVLFHSSDRPVEAPSWGELLVGFSLGWRVFTRSRWDSLRRARGHKSALCDFPSAAGYLVRKGWRVLGQCRLSSPAKKILPGCEREAASPSYRFGHRRILRISVFVVRNYLTAIYDEIGVSNRVELALWYWTRKQEGSPIMRSLCGKAPSPRQVAAFVGMLIRAPWQSRDCCGQCTLFSKLMDLERISNFSQCVCWRLYGITAAASFEYALSCELVPSAVTT